MSIIVTLEGMPYEEILRQYLNGNLLNNMSNLSALEREVVSPVWIIKKMPMLFQTCGDSACDF